MITYTHEDAAKHLEALPVPRGNKIFQVVYNHLESGSESKITGNILPAEESFPQGTYEAKVILIHYTTKDGHTNQAETEMESFKFKVEPEEPETDFGDLDEQQQVAPVTAGIDAHTQLLITTIQAQAIKETQSSKDFYENMAGINERAQREVREERRVTQELIAQERQEAMRLVSSVARQAVGGDIEDEPETGANFMEQAQQFTAMIPQFQAFMAAFKQGQAGTTPAQPMPDIPTDQEVPE